MTSITLLQIKYLLALEKTGSFSLAAVDCHVTQSTLSTMIRKLEDQLDLLLFNRTSKPVTMTLEGKLLLHQFKQIQHSVETLGELVQETKDDFYGTMRIGVIPTIAPFLFPLFLDKLVISYPNINFIIDEITTDDIVYRLKQRELDVGIVSLPIVDKELVEQVLYYEDFLVYDASQPDIKNYRVTTMDTNKIWLLEEGHCMRTQVERICMVNKKREFSKNLVYNSGSILSLLELVKINKGMTLIPRLASIRNQLIDENCIYKIAGDTPVRQVGLITHPNFAKKRMLKVLVEHITVAVKPILKKKNNFKIIEPF